MNAETTRSPHTRLRFPSVLVVSKREAFELCEACAEAERALLRAGRAPEAARMAFLFELIEARLVEPAEGLEGPAGAAETHYASRLEPSCGSNSSESEFTQ